MSRPASHHPPQGTSQEAPAGWSGPQGARQRRGTQPHPVPPPEPCPLSGVLGPRNNLSMGEAAPSTWQCPIHHPWLQCQGPSWGSRPFEGGSLMGQADQWGSQLPSGQEPPPLHSSLIPTAQKGYRSPCPAWVQFTNRLPQGLVPPPRCAHSSQDPPLQWALGPSTRQVSSKPLLGLRARASHHCLQATWTPLGPRSQSRLLLP